MPVHRDSNIEQVFRVVLDLLALFIASNLAFDLRYYIDWQGLIGDVVKGGPAPWGALYQAMPYMLLGWFVIFATFGLYRPGLRRREEIALLIKAQAVAFGLLFATAFFYRGFSYSRLAALFLVPFSFLLTLGFRTLYRIGKEQLLKLRAVRERVLVVGSTGETANLLKRLGRPDNPYQLLGVLTRNGEDLPDGAERLGELAELGRVLTRSRVDRVLLMSGNLTHGELTEAIDACYRHRVDWAVVPDLYDMLVDRLRLEQVAGVPVMGPAGSNLVGMNLAVKRVVDLLVGTLLLLVLSPFMLLTALLVKITSRGPVFFSQKRVGRGGRPFRLYKFRSMYAQSRDKKHREVMARVIENGEAGCEDGNGKIYKMKTDPRITPFGRFIRRFSLDELPQLLNVLKGDMSLVGPRPAVPYEVEKYTHRDRRRLETLPGITGLWQVSGRNRLSFDEMVELDIQYIENWSVGMDVRIFFKTLTTVIFSRGY